MIKILILCALATTSITCIADNIDKETSIAGLGDIPGARGKDGGVTKETGVC